MSQGSTKGVPIDTDSTMAANSDALVPSQKAVKTSVIAKQFKRPLAILTTVACGNSITVISQDQTSGYGKAIHFANMLSSSCMEFKRVTATTRTDIYGIYGYSGVSLETILGDLETQWFAPLATAGVIPDLVLGYSLLENDITQGRTLVQMKQSLDAWMSTVKNRWQGVRILLNTPHPSINYSTALMQQNYLDIKAYILSLDNNYDVFVTELNGYISASVTGNPITDNITASLSGTTLTVTATSQTLAKGDYVLINGSYLSQINYIITGTGGVGTYNVYATGTIASTTFVLSKYTDGVHPNAKGALINARQNAITLKRISDIWKRNYTGFSTNMNCYGTGAAVAPITGTVVTNFATPNAVNATYVATAELPNQKMDVTVAAGTTGNAVALGSFNFGSNVISGVTSISPFVVIELISGSANIKFPSLAARITDGGGNLFQYFLTVVSSDSEADWQDGDIITFVYPPKIAGSGSMSALTNYIIMFPKYNGGQFVFRIKSQGYYKIN